MQDGEPIDAEQVRRGLVGNLCRCTGYDSIFRAALAVEPGDASSRWTQMYPPGHFHRRTRGGSGRRSSDRSRRQGSFTSRPPSSAPFNSAARIRVASSSPARRTWASFTTSGLREIDVALSLAGLAELRAITCDGDALYVGATATLSSLEAAALAHLPEFGRFLAWFGSPLIKNAGTLGGNLVTGSPIGDTIPALMALGAEIDIAGAAGTPARADRSVLHRISHRPCSAPDELVTGVRIPLPGHGETFKLYKVSRRKDLDISSFGAAIWMKQSNGVDRRRPHRLRRRRADGHADDEGGSGAPRAMRRRSSDSSRPGELARDEVTPITDVRGSEQYRRTLAREHPAEVLARRVRTAAERRRRQRQRSDGPSAMSRASRRGSVVASESTRARRPRYEVER